MFTYTEFTQFEQWEYVNEQFNINIIIKHNNYDDIFRLVFVGNTRLRIHYIDQKFDNFDEAKDFAKRQCIWFMNHTIEVLQDLAAETTKLLLAE